MVYAIRQPGLCDVLAGAGLWHSRPMSAGMAGGTTETRIAIAGGGAAGALVAANLLRLGGRGLEVVVVEPRSELGLGVAYSTRDPWHRLNVPAVSMSAIAGEPDHFQRWADAPPEAFLRRLDFGRYLQAVLAEAAEASPSTLRHVRGTVDRLEPAGDGVRLTLSTGERLEADALVLATGLELPPTLGYLDAWADDPRVILDPWAAGALDDVHDGDAIAVIGSSLTAIDVTGSILNAHPLATVIALSRHGDLPRPHEDPWRPRLPDPAFTVEEFLAFKSPLDDAVERIASYGGDWPRAVDSLRPIGQRLWMAMDDSLKATFLAHHRHVWDIHRHRVAADIGRDLDRWIEDGRFSVQAAAIEGVEADGGRLRIIAGPDSWTVDRIVLAVGPDPDASASPLLGAAIADGYLRPGPMGIAIDVDPATGRVLDRSGEPVLPVYAMGALRKGVLWETLAIPEIRDQAADVARQLVGEAAVT